MAREDIIINLLGQLYERRKQDPPSQNTQLQKILLANDAAALDDSQIAAALTSLSNLKWGGRLRSDLWRGSGASLDSGQQVAFNNVPRFVTTAFGRGLLCEDTTKNLVKDAGFDTATAIGSGPWVLQGGLGAGDSVAKDAAVARTPGKQSVKVVCASGTNGVGAKQKITAGWTAGSSVVSVSGYLYVPSRVAGTVNVDLIADDGTTNVLDTSGASLTATNSGFVRVKTEGVTIPSSAVNLWVRVFADGTPNLTFYADDIQVEVRNEVSSFYGAADDTSQVTRNGEGLTVPRDVITPAAGTIEMVIVPYSRPYDWASLFELGKYDPAYAWGCDELVFYNNPQTSSGKTFQLSFRNSATQVSQAASVALPAAMTYGNLYYIAGGWSLPGTIKVWVYDYAAAHLYTGTYAATITPGAYLGFPNIFLGSRSSGMSAPAPRSHGSTILATRFTRRIRSDAEIAASYPNQANLVADADTSALFKFDGSLIASSYVAPGFAWGPGGGGEWQ